MRQQLQNYFGDNIIIAYGFFDQINEALFNGELPEPLITIHNTKYGKITSCETLLDTNLLPSINIQSQIIGNLDLVKKVLIHECMHIAIKYLRGGYKKENTIITSHNNEKWVAEINRVAPLIGLNLKASFAKMKRVNGKPRRTPKKGCISYGEMAKFPYYILGDIICQ